MSQVYESFRRRPELRRQGGNPRQDVLSRHAAEVDSTARFPEESVAALRASGLLGLTLPAALGGAGQGPRVFAAVVEELAQRCASTAMVYVMHVAARAGHRLLDDARRKRRDAPRDRRRQAPDDAGALREGLALAVLGAGVEADRDGSGGFTTSASQVLGHLGRPRRLVRLERRSARRAVAARVDALPRRARGDARRRSPGASTASDCAATTRRPSPSKGSQLSRRRPDHARRARARRRCCRSCCPGSPWAPRRWRTACAARR